MSEGLNPFQLEQIVLGMLLRYPKEAPGAVLPNLTHNRFVYAANGKLGRQDHASIMQAITLCAQAKKKAPFPVDIKPLIGVELGLYIDALVDMVESRYRIYTFDMRSMQSWADQVDRNGFMYMTALKAKTLGKVADSEEEFIQYVAANQDVDVDVWANKVLTDFSVPATSDRTAYRHTSELVEGVIDLWRRQRNGEQTFLLNSGLPVLMGNGLFPVGKTVFVHGMSGNAKSLFVHQVNLGTAIGLYVNNIQGCVAINSLEMSYEELLGRYAAALAGFDMTRLFQDPAGISDEDMQRLEDWMWFVGGLPLYVDDTNLINTSAIEYRLNSLHNTEVGPVWQLSMDYLGLLEDIDADSTEEKYANAARELFRISRLTKASVIGISQSTYTDTRHYIAGLLGMRYSKGITHAADGVIEVYNPPAMKKAGMNFTLPAGVTNDQQIWFDMQKCRWGGFLGWFAMGYEAEYNRVFDPSLDTLGGQTIVFNHVYEARKMMKAHAKATVPAVADTVFGDFQ
jgi:hypothetical protein